MFYNCKNKLCIATGHAPYVYSTSGSATHILFKNPKIRILINKLFDERMGASMLGESPCIIY